MRLFSVHIFFSIYKKNKRYFYDYVIYLLIDKEEKINTRLQLQKIYLNDRHFQVVIVKMANRGIIFPIENIIEACSGQIV